MAIKQNIEAQNPLILRCNRIMEAFAKSNDERDFYLDRTEGFLLYVDLDKSQEELNSLDEELSKNHERYCNIPKMTFYETKKIMEGFVNEKVYDIDTKEKLLDIIQSKEARENFLEFILDHHSELEKWQQYYQERSRIRIIEWLRQNHFHFVFEEDLELPRHIVEKIKENLFQIKAPKEILAARKNLIAKAKTYYSNEALNPRPKRGRPPKQAIKTEAEPQITSDIYTTVPTPVRPFLFTPDVNSTLAITFSSKFDSEEQLLATRRPSLVDTNINLQDINQKLATLRSLSSGWKEQPDTTDKASLKKLFASFDDDENDDENGEDTKNSSSKKKTSSSKKKTPKEKSTPKKASTKTTTTKTAPKPVTSAKKTASAQPKRPPVKRIIPKTPPKPKK